jgi:hypothetical protein
MNEDYGGSWRERFFVLQMVPLNLRTIGEKYLLFPRFRRIGGHFKMVRKPVLRTSPKNFVNKPNGPRTSAWAHSARQLV